MPTPVAQHNSEQRSSAESQAPAVTIVMPALNEQENIEAAIHDALAALDHYHLTGELIVVNDGSTDGTPALVRARQQQDSRIRVIDHQTPQGIGGSFWDGVGQARGEAVVLLPGDNEVNPLEALRYFPLLEHVDMVVPFVFNPGVRSSFRRGLSWLYRVLVDTAFGINFNYTNGTVLYRRVILSDIVLCSKGFFYQTELLVKTGRRGYLFAEVPYALNRRRFGRSKAISLKSLAKVVKGYLQLARDVYFSNEKRPLHPDSISCKRRAAAD